MIDIRKQELDLEGDAAGQDGLNRAMERGEKRKQKERVSGGRGGNVAQLKKLFWGIGGETDHFKCLQKELSHVTESIRDL